MMNVEEMNKDVTVQVRLTAEEHRRWLAAADAEDRTLSNWIRRQCNAAALPKVAPIFGTDIEDELIARAIKTYMRGEAPDQPSGASAVEEINGQPYVVLRNTRGELAYYQIVSSSDGKYKLKLDVTQHAGKKAGR